MNNFEIFDDNQYDTLTHEQREQLDKYYSSKDIQKNLLTLEANIGEKVSQVNNQILTDPATQQLKELVDAIKGPLEYDLLEQQNRINKIKLEISECENGGFGGGDDANVEQRLGEYKKKLNATYSSMINLLRGLDFADFAKCKYPKELQPSFDRWVGG